MAYRVMGWDGDFRTKDMFSAHGRIHANVTRKPDALEAARKFMAHPPVSEDGHVTIEQTSSRYGSEVMRRWEARAHPWRWVNVK